MQFHITPKEAAAVIADWVEANDFAVALEVFHPRWGVRSVDAGALRARTLEPADRVWIATRELVGIEEFERSSEWVDANVRAMSVLLGQHADGSLQRPCWEQFRPVQVSSRRGAGL